MNINVRRFALYAVAIVAIVIGAKFAGSAFLSIYWPLAFWSLVALDFSKNSEDLSLADRFIGYIFAAPFIFPVRAYDLCVARRS